MQADLLIQFLSLNVCVRTCLTTKPHHLIVFEKVNVLNFYCHL